MSAATPRAVAFTGALFLAIYLLERLSGADPRRYLTRNFGQDLGYSLFYRIFYNPVVYAVIVASLSPHLVGFELNLLSSLPLPLAFGVFWVACDFCQYWVHRLQHGNRMLWAFHRMHHSQELLTFPAAYRNHPFEQFVSNLLMLVPLRLLGVPAFGILVVALAQEFLDAIQHSDLSWRFGRLYRVVVSPAFHAMHHSIRPEHHDRNFGKIFSVWDHLFGTAIAYERPAKYGVQGPPMRTLSEQLLGPFRELLGAVRAAGASSVAQTETSRPLR